ncbi:hypothetical protein ABS71_04995 [bacterium SCN 62-11]|nr:methyltransferase domain-containing protein [Candidatus Eremiobacteraeota bacterium]ODT74954.1 MAG: hypothetical protein ABS71_04995 [bacterium SCN 62-11]
MHYSLDFTRRLLLEAGTRDARKILDVGCGLGDVAALALTLVGDGAQIIGIDRNEAALERARQRTSQATFRMADLTDLPDDLKDFDAIIGRRVLMYQADPARALSLLVERLKPGGLVVFQEADLSMVPARLTPLPLHEKTLGWIREMVRQEGCDLQMGFHLHQTFTAAGLSVQGVRAEAIVQTPTQPSLLGDIVRAVLPRLLEQGVTTEAEVEADTLQARLDAERIESGATFIGDMMFGAWGRRDA